MLGSHVLTESDIFSPAGHGDVVVLGSDHMDFREVQRTWRWVFEHPRPVSMVFTEGYLLVPAQPYPIPYRCLVPKEEDRTNLLVPVCLSASHVAFSSVRVEVQDEMLGQVAGMAAAQASASGRAVQRIDVRALQGRLRDTGQVLAL